MTMCVCSLCTFDIQKIYCRTCFIGESLARPYYSLHSETNQRTKYLEIIYIFITLNEFSPRNENLWELSV
jgi:hypothetical protein